MFYGTVASVSFFISAAAVRCVSDLLTQSR